CLELVLGIVAERGQETVEAGVFESYAVHARGQASPSPGPAPVTRELSAPDCASPRKSRQQQAITGPKPRSPASARERARSRANCARDLAAKATPELRSPSPTASRRPGARGG